LELALEPFVIVRKNGPNGVLSPLNRRMLVRTLLGAGGLAHLPIMCSTDSGCKSFHVKKAAERSCEAGVEVMLQFLVEAVVLSAAGGLIGIAFGVGGSLALASAMGWPFVLTPFWIFVAFGISIAIGVIFG
jgi:hypothetical protein